MSAAPPSSAVRVVLRNRWVRLAVGAACLAVAGWLAYGLRRTLAPFGLAAFAAYIVGPVVTFLHVRLRVPRALAAAALVLALTAVLVGAVAVGISYVVRTVERVVPAAQRELGREEPQRGLGERLRATLASIPNELRVQIDQVLKELPATIRENFREISTSVFLGLHAVARTFLGIVVTTFEFVLFFIVMGYLLSDGPRLGEAAKGLLPAAHRDAILRVLGEINVTLRAYFRGSFLVALCLCVIYSVGLLICQVDFAILIGVAGGLSDMVPYLGLVVGMVPALLFASVPYTGLVKPLGVVMVFAIGQTFAGFVLVPRIVGRRVGLHPVAVLMAVMVLGRLLGVFGVLFAVPLTAVLRVLLRETMSWWQATQGRIEAPGGGGRQGE